MFLLTRCLSSSPFLGTSFISLTAQENTVEADFHEMFGPSVFMHKDYLNEVENGRS